MTMTGGSSTYGWTVIDVCVLEFIRQFREFDPAVADMFRSNRFDYWFAQILFRRFINDGSSVLYSPSSAHFIVRIGGRLYDIDGDVTDKYEHLVDILGDGFSHYNKFVQKYYE